MMVTRRQPTGMRKVSWANRAPAWLAGALSVLLPGVGLLPGPGQIVPARSSGLVRQKSQPGAAQSLDFTLIGSVLRREYETTPRRGTIGSVVFSPDGNSLACGCVDRGTDLWDLRTKMIRHTFYGHGKPLAHSDYAAPWVNSTAFSPDGKTLATGDSDGAVRFWDTVSGKLRQVFQAHTDWIPALAFSGDGRTFASASLDGTVKLWDARTGTLRQLLTGQAAPVTDVAFSRNSRILASSTEDMSVQLWDARTGKLRRTLTVPKDPGTPPEVNTHGDPLDPYRIRPVAFSPNGKTLASVGENSTLKLWDVRTGKLKRSFKGHAGWVFSVAFSPDGRTLASGSGDNSIKLWDSRSGKLSRTLQGPGSWVISVAFSPDGMKLACGSMDGTLRLWYLGHDPALTTPAGQPPFVGDWFFTVNGFGQFEVKFFVDGTLTTSEVPAGRILSSGTWRLEPDSRVTCTCLSVTCPDRNTPWTVGSRGTSSWAIRGGNSLILTGSDGQVSTYSRI